MTHPTDHAGRRAQSRAPSTRPPRVNHLVSLLGLASWKPFFSALLLPPVPLIVLMFIGARLILPRRGLGWSVILITAVLSWFSATTGAAALLARALLDMPPALGAARIAEIKAQVQAKQPIAIVVLGGGAFPLSPEYGVSNLTPTSLERLRYGVWLGRETGAPVAFSGGLGWAQVEGGTPEAQIAQRIATHEFGRPLRWLEDQSKDTRQNAALTVAMLRQQGIREIVLVTHDYHQPRAQRAFAEAAAQDGLRIVPAPLGILSMPQNKALDWIPGSAGFTSVQQVLHEAIGRLAGA